MVRSPGRRPPAFAGAVLCAALLVGACGGGPAVPGPSASGGSSTTAAGASSGVAGGQACATGEARTKPVPAEAQALVRAFVDAVDGGDAAAARRLLDPAFADQVLADLAPARRLTLLTVSDDY